MERTNPLLPRTIWSEWYAGYIVARERGRMAGEAANDATLALSGARDLAQA
ncbi:MAG: hypothetical protein ABIQ52_03435 [Vicinamibacterales bacterium]